MHANISTKISKLQNIILTFFIINVFEIIETMK